MSDKGEKLLEKHILETHNEVSPNTAIDPITVVTIITTILELIRGCRNPQSARSHINRGSAIARTRVNRTLKKAKYPGNRKEMSTRLVDKGINLTESEVTDILEESQDLPEPPPETGVSWPLWVLAFISFLALSPSTSSAQLWPLEERVTILEEKVDAIEKVLQTFEKPISSPEKLTTAIQVKNIAKTDICKCQGYKKQECFCLQRGQPCKCNSSTGSVWNMTPDNKPINKTGNYANPVTQQSIQQTQVTNPQPTYYYSQPSRRQAKYSYQCVNGRCYRVRVR